MIANAAQAFSLQLERTLELAGAFLLALLLVTITFSVLLRYVAESGFTGAEEAASWLLVALVSIGLPLASTARGLRIDLFEARLASDQAQIARGIWPTVDQPNGKNTDLGKALRHARICHPSERSDDSERRQGFGRRVPTIWRSSFARLRSRRHRRYRYSRRGGGAD